MTEQATVLTQAAQQLYDSARSHKRSEGFHRKQARLCMQQLDELKAKCREFGIEVEIVQAKENHVHGLRKQESDP